MIQKRLLVLCAFLIFANCIPAFAQDENMQDVVYLKNGRVVRGEIVSREGKNLSIKTESGYIFSYDSSEVKKVTKEKTAPSARHLFSTENRGLENSLYCNLGLSSPSGPSDFSNNWVTGLSLGVGYGFGMSPAFSLIVSGQYSNFPLSYSSYYQGVRVTASGGGYHTLTFLANGKYIITGIGNPAALYFIGGLGPAFLSRDVLTVTGSYGGYSASSSINGVSETDVALRLGLGLDFVISEHTAVYGELDIVDTFVSSSASIDGSGTISNTLLSVGLKFDLPTASGSEVKE